MIKLKRVKFVSDVVDQICMYMYPCYNLVLSFVLVNYITI